MKALFAKLLGIPRQVLEFLIPVLTKQLGVSLAVLLPIALGIVKELASVEKLSNKQKREKASKELIAAAAAEGINAANSLINLAIEMAVNKLKTTPGGDNA